VDNGIVNVNKLRIIAPTLNAGDEILLSVTVFTARDYLLRIRTISYNKIKKDMHVAYPFLILIQPYTCCKAQRIFRFSLKVPSDFPTLRFHFQ